MKERTHFGQFTKSRGVFSQKTGFLALAMLALAQGVLSAAAHPPRERLLMDSGWRFAFGHPSDAQKDFSTGTGYFYLLAAAELGVG